MIPEQSKSGGFFMCPACGGKVSYDPPYWVKQGRYFCSQKCAR